MSGFSRGLESSDAARAAGSDRDDFTGLAADLAAQIVELAEREGVDVAEAVVSVGSELSVRVRKGEVELVSEAKASSLGLRAMKGKRVGMTASNDRSAEGLRRLVHDAAALASLSEEDPFVSVPAASELMRNQDRKPLELFDEAVLSLDAQACIERAKAAEAVVMTADARIGESEGSTFARAFSATALVMSGGFCGVEQSSLASVVARPVARDAEGKNRSGFFWDAKRHLGDLAPESEVAAEAVRRTVSKLGSRSVKSGRFPVVFSPEAGRSIVGLFAGCINGSSLWRRTSYLAERLGSQVASSLVSLVDDPLVPRALGSRAFDGEGLAARRNALVSDGVLESYVLDCYSAKRLGLRSTASAHRGGAGGVGPGVSNLILVPGKVAADELLADLTEGIYVTDMMGFGFNSSTGDFSRGAAGHWISDGKLSHPVSEITISLNLDALLKGVDGVGNDLDRRSAIMSPTFRVNGMTVAGSS